MKKGNIILALGIIIAFIALGAGAFRKTLTPYVTLREARESGARVQVSGKIDKKRVRYDIMKGVLSFPLRDHEGSVATVLYRGVKPGNFDQAEQVVVIGRMKGNHFEADEMLLKCPSKYQSTPGKGSSLSQE